MKKKIILLGFIFVMVITNINWLSVYAKENFTSLNPVIDVGDEIYVQHDEDNQDIYDLKKSGTGTTIVYKTMLVKFTADKAWTRDGKYIDNVSSVPHGATAPEDYIAVKPGEEYFIKTYGVAITEGIWYVPVLFLDNNDKVISDVLTAQFSKSKAGVTITVPENATKMHFTMYNHQNFTLQKVLYLTDKEFDNLPVNKTELEEEIKQKYEEYEKDKTVYKIPKKAYITFVNDDTWGSIDEYAQLFTEKNIPLVLATIPELLIENASSQKETRLDVVRRVEASGGEILAHNSSVLTKEDFADYNKMYSCFVRTKQLFNYYGLNVNGIILSGGTGQIAGAQESEEWASSIYSYSDLYGVQYKKKEIALDSVYYHGRGNLGNYGNDLDRIKQEIDKAIENPTWVVFYFHAYNEIDKDVLEQVLDYVNSKSEEELEVVTYKEMYEKNAAKESDIINTKATYYVSATGTSKTGTDEDNPMSYETAKSKTYRSGDTILLKKGDTFYGTFNPNVLKIDDKVTTISSYGEGELPNISGYKIADSQESWQLHSEGIYKINLTDTQFFSGLTSTDGNSTNIGFLEDKTGTKYFSKKGSLSELENEYDFYCDETYLYIKSDTNPYDRLGELKLATKTNLFILHSNMKIEDIKFSGTGAHGLVGSDESTENVEISNNIIENIGGSYLRGTTRYGNGIEFYATNASDVTVKNNIFRNIYDVGFTMQGNKGSGKNVVVEGNVFVGNSHDSEIWESDSATGIESYEFTKNISVNSGRGWGYDARPDKYASAHILFWAYLIENTDIYFHDNIVYNPRRLYFIEQTNGTNIFFKEKNYIKSDYNTYFMAEDAKIFRDSYQVSEKEVFVSEYKKDNHSVFSQIEPEENIIKISTETDQISEIKKMFEVSEPEPTVTLEPTVVSTPLPTEEPTALPTPLPTEEPTEKPTEEPTVVPSPVPTKEPTVTPSPTITEEPIVTAYPTITKEVTVTPTSIVINVATVTAVPTPTYMPVVSDTPTQILQPTLTPLVGEIIPKEGEILTDKKTKAVYTVTKAGVTKGTVMYTRPTNRNMTTVSVPKTVAIDGITYKVTAVAPAAFKNCKRLKKATIGGNVTIIGDMAFGGCSRLKTVNLGNSVNTIGNKAFYKCSALTKITIPSKVTRIGKLTFYHCKKLKHITIKTTKLTSKRVGSKAFEGIYPEAVIRVPKGKLESYRKLLKARGVSSKAKIKE